MSSASGKINYYEGELPESITTDPRIKPFFEKFYAVSDNPDDHEAYAKSFTKDADFIMGSRKVKGYDAILEVRKSLWTGPVKTRQHRLFKIFPYGDNTNEVMLYGNVKYGLKNGKEVSVEWAGRALFKDEGGKVLKMAHYQVYLDSTPVANAMKED